MYDDLYFPLSYKLHFLLQCVKALLFHTGGHGVCNVNITNDAGDTALHNAARWGFGELSVTHYVTL